MTQITKLRSWHKDLVDYFLLNPGASQREAARHFGVSESWLSQLMNTDAFKAYEAKRRAEHQEMISRVVISGAAARVAEAGLKRLEQEIKGGLPYSPSELVEATDMALRALGFQPQRGSEVNVEVSVPTEVILNAREKMAKVIEVNSGEEEKIEDAEEVNGE